MQKKGIATWIMVIGSLILGMTVFYFGAMLIGNQMKNTQKQGVIDALSDLYGKLKTNCMSGGIGQLYHYKISLPENVRAVYVTNNSLELPPDKVSVLISERESNVGNYFCFQFFDENLPRCLDVGCQTNFTYIGTPSMKTDLFTVISRLAKGQPTYDYKILINKTDFHAVGAQALPVVGEEVVKTTTTLPLTTTLAGTATPTGTTITTTSTTTTTIPPSFIILFIQLNSNIPDFERKSQAGRDLWVQLTPLSACPDRVQAIAVTDRICNAPDQTIMCTGTETEMEQVYQQTMQALTQCAIDWGYGGNYTRIEGVVRDHDRAGAICCIPGEGCIGGYTGGYGSPLVSAEGSIESVSSHEMGHTFGLCDEGYGGGYDNRCPSGYSSPGGGTDCYPGSNCCPNHPEYDSIYCTLNLCNRPCSYAVRFAPSSYSHLENELNSYCS